MRRINAMLWKKVRSSLGEVSTEREGASQLWAVKGTEVSMVSVVESSAAEEIGRRRDGLHDKAATRGFRRLDRDDEEATCDRAISIV